ncbi:MAG: lycopene beta-cyclase CrtY [Pseudomonadota bacterium]
MTHGPTTPDGESGLYDVAIVGGGLSGCLTAYRLSRRGQLKILLLEAGPGLGGNHTWSFHETDVPASVRDWLAPFVAHRWSGHDVRFPAYRRTLQGGYWSVTSDRLRAVMSTATDLDVRLDASVSDVSIGSVTLADRDVLQARVVLDARGDRRAGSIIRRYQKFLGQELELASPHGLTRPILMDASVGQADGYRFIYVLPFTDNRLLIEDTYYADGPDRDADLLRGRIAEYANAQGWSIARLIREEAGTLPIALGGRPPPFDDDQPPSLGLRAGLFHPTTGYSLPDAASLADHLASLDALDAAAARRAIADWTAQRWRRRGFYRLLNRMMFLAGRSQDRWRVMARFYRLPEPLIARFYADRLTLADRARLLIGKPPVPIRGALSVVSERSLTS